MNIVWTADIHLNFIDSRKFTALCNDINSEKPDYIIISGDIGEAPSVDIYLEKLAMFIKVPIFFVLGNHDFYYGSIQGVRNTVDELCKKSDNLCYLTNSDVQILHKGSEKFALIGHDGWGDCGYGNLSGDIKLNDWYLINDFQKMSMLQISVFMKYLAQESVKQLEVKLVKAFKEADTVVLSTHVPPFKECSTYRGVVSSNDYLPMYCNKMLGDMLIKYMNKHKNKGLIVLCGHTHDEVCKNVTENIVCNVSGSDYKKPRMYVLELSNKEI